MMEGFTQLDIVPNIDDAPWRDLDGCPGGVLRRVSVVPNGTTNGKPSVGLAIQMEDGSWVIAQTTLALFQSAARVFAARYPTP